MSLVDELKSVLHTYLQSEDEKKQRLQVISLLRHKFQVFLQRAEVSGNLFVFGSESLGIQEKGSDIDIVCVVGSPTLTRSDFFDRYSGLLSDAGFSIVNIVQTVRVPVLKCKHAEIDVNIVCSIIPEYLVKEKKFDPMEYPGDAMDITSYLSLQGYRDAQFLLNCIEEEELDNFVLLLRTVRLWAKANYVFSSTFGPAS